MIRYIQTSLFDSPAQTLVNTVNTVGVMGKGIAKEFKKRYPSMYKEYRAICDEGALRPGLLHVWRTDNRCVLNFPTKINWRNPSKLSYVEDGLKKFLEVYSDLGITSASFPPLGCGNGNLDWKEVKPIMESYLNRAMIPIYIHDIQVPEGFVPEHKHNVSPPTNYYEFLKHLAGAIEAEDGVFHTSAKPFKVKLDDAFGIKVVLNGGRQEYIDREMIEESWLRLQDKYLAIDSFGDEKSKRVKSYLFPILQSLPYVMAAQMRNSHNSHAMQVGLFFDRQAENKSLKVTPASGEQGCLFL